MNSTRLGLRWIRYKTAIGLLLPLGVSGLWDLAEGTTRLVPQDYLTIQAAVDAAVHGDSILLAPGTYRGVGNRDIELRGKNLVVTSSAGPLDTVIDCEQAGRGFYLHEHETATVERLTIQNGYARAFAGDPGTGGGIRCGVTIATISDCRILNNHADTNGGGVYFFVFEGRLQRCFIAGNSAVLDGGGVAEPYGVASIQDCVIVGNTAGSGGGVSFNGTGSNTLQRCTISGNFSQHGGGGVWTGNPAYLDRCIVWDNSAGSGADEIDVRQHLSASCCAIDTTGVEYNADVTYDPYCVYADPLFCAPPADDFSLRADSPCLPEHSPCGLLIGALGQGCGGPALMGACCFADGSCLVREESQCDDEQGSYQGDGTVCEPGLCVPIPVEKSTWGRIKAQYRGEAR
jgi:hypothetical protein